MPVGLWPSTGRSAVRRGLNEKAQADGPGLCCRSAPALELEADAAVNGVGLEVALHIGTAEVERIAAVV